MAGQFTQAAALTYAQEAPRLQALLSNLPMQAYWLDRTRVAIPQAHYQRGSAYAIHWSLRGGMQLTDSAINSGEQIQLQPGGSLTADESMRYPQLASYAVLTVSPHARLSTIQYALKGQLILTAIDSTGKVTYATELQYAGVLDDLFFYPGSLGVVIDHQRNHSHAGSHEDRSTVQLKLWAPTAQKVSLKLYDAAGDSQPSAAIRMTEQDGVWSAHGSAAWFGKYYLYSVTMYSPYSQSRTTYLTSDPYSIDIALNGAKSRITDLDSEATRPSGWDTVPSPVLRSLNDMSIYELHVRDFSIADPTVPSEHRGMYMAFTDIGSQGMKHLHDLAQSGLKAVHLLPTFHFSSRAVNEDKSKWESPGNLASYPPNGEQQQTAIVAVRSKDAYNWGYDPVHYMVPEGSYAIDPDKRILEYRTMVESLHKAGLRVIQDVVFNHTSTHGESPESNLDETTPLYYHRLNANGELMTGSCCADTASEHRMMEKLIIDTLLLNAKEYKIDGFRFDLMSMHFTYNLKAIRHALDSLTLAKDGVDGAKIYVYGEGWNFSETANSAIGANASQLNLYGYSVGTFNDRMRDGIRGNNATDLAQGFATGLWTDPNGSTAASPTSSDQKNTLLSQEDWIRIGLAGNLRDYSFTDATDTTVKGSQISFRNAPAGYAATPIEAVNYCSVHDDIDLFDSIQLKSSISDSASTRARRQQLAMSLVLLGQGVPFIQGGDDLLRSKDMESDSYNSGDWFNKIDWSGSGNNWGIGLPIPGHNQKIRPTMQQLLANRSLQPSPNDIHTTEASFQDFLRIRYSSPLFRMKTLTQIQRNLSFLNTGSNQIPDLIVMKLDAAGEVQGEYKHIVVFFNANNSRVEYQDHKLQGIDLALHPVQQNSDDPIPRQSKLDVSTGTAEIPALTTAVFVSR